MSDSSKDRLYEACFQGSKQLAVSLINQEAVSYVDPSTGDTPLHLACKQGWLDVVKMMIETYGCDPNVMNKDRQKPVHYAYQRNIGIVQYLTSLQRSKTYTSSESLLILLTNCPTIVQKIEQESQSAFDPKRAEFDTVFELVCTSELIMSHTCSTALSDWLQYVTLDDNQFAEIIPKCTWKTANGDTLLQLMCQNESCLSRISSLVFVIWLRITPLYHVNISLPDSRTADGDTLLQLVCRCGESTISRVSSTVLLKWLRDTTIELRIQDWANCKTADGCILFELMCQSRTCISRLSSAEFLTLLEKVHITSITESIPDCETIDHDTILQLVLQSKMFVSCVSSKVLLRWLNSSNKLTVDQMKVVHPKWKTLDDDCFLHVLCNSKLEDGKVIELVEYYWLKGILNPNLLNRKGNTALHIACKADKPSLVSYLLISAQCHPCILNKEDNFPLDMTTNPEIIECLCQHPEVLIRQKTISRWINKKSVDYLQIIKVLLDIYNHTDILHLILNCNVKSEFSNRIVELVAYLLDVFPDCLDVNESLKLTSNTKIMKMLLVHGAKMTKDVVFKVISSNHIKESEARSLFVLAKNNMLWTPNDLNSDGKTALHLACIVEKPAIVDYLLTEANCNPNAYDELPSADEQYYESPLEVSTNLEIAKTLIEHGARVTPELVLRFESMEEVQEEKCKLIELMLTTWNPSDIDSNGYTALHLACKADNPALVNLLLSVAYCDPNIESTIEKVVPLQITENPEIIKDLIRYGAKASAMYKSHGNTLGTNKPVKPPVKMFVVGNPSAGKSTLTAALKKKQRIGARFFASGKVTGVDQKTVGIVPHEIESDAFGKVTLYDFAGHREFYSGHAALLQTAIQSTPPIFLLVVDLRDDNDAVTKNVTYWVSFLENQCASVNCKPHIILIGSHADSLRSSAKNKIKAIVDSLKYSDANSFINMELVGYVAMDCQFHVSSDMNDLRRLLIRSCNELRTQEPITFNAHCFLVYLLDTFKSSTAVTINTIYNDIENRLKSPIKENVLEFLPENFEALYKICLELNDRGHILLLRDREKIEDSYIVIDKAFLLTEMSGTVFSREGFKYYTQLSTNTGVVPRSKLADSFPEKDLNIVIGFLNHLEFCHEIADQALRQLISEQYSETYDDKERFYLFPALISVDSNDSIWKVESQFEHNFGWSIRCIYDEQFFSSRFLQVLLLRLAFSFAKVSGSDHKYGIHRKCSIWKNGIFWGKNFNMDVLVEVTDNKSVTVIARFANDNLLKCIQHRSEVIQTILECIQQFCPRIETTESFIDSSSGMQYPLDLNTDEFRCTVQDLCEALTSDCEHPSVVLSDSGRTVRAERFLSFEPYAEVSLPTLCELFDKNAENEVVPEHAFITGVASSKLIELFVQIFGELANIFTSIDDHVQEDDTTSKQMTYKYLRQKLDQYSVFAGRNILDLVEHKLLSSLATKGVTTHLSNIPVKGNTPQLHELQLLKFDNGSELRIMEIVTPEWKNVAIALGYDGSRIKTMEMDAHYQSGNACLKMFTGWLEGGHDLRPPTWAILIASLKAAKLIPLANLLSNKIKLESDLEAEDTRDDDCQNQPKC